MQYALMSASNCHGSGAKPWRACYTTVARLLARRPASRSVAHCSRFRWGNDMARITKELLAPWAADTRQVPFQRRNWPAVRGLAAFAVLLLLLSLPAELILASRKLAVLCWTGAALAIGAMAIWLFARRLFVARS